jgi:hypothetical protein
MTLGMKQIIVEVPDSVSDECAQYELDRAFHATGFRCTGILLTYKMLLARCLFLMRMLGIFCMI